MRGKMNDLIRREDAIGIFSERAKSLRGMSGDLGVACRGVMRIIELLPSAEPERKWIPVTEALPKNYEQTICIDSRGKMMIGMYGEYGWTFPCYMTEPVAWMPLPEPWKGE